MNWKSEESTRTEETQFRDWSNTTETWRTPEDSETWNASTAWSQPDKAETWRTAATAWSQQKWADTTVAWRQESSELWTGTAVAWRQPDSSETTEEIGFQYQSEPSSGSQRVENISSGSQYLSPPQETLQLRQEALPSQQEHERQDSQQQQAGQPLQLGQQQQESPQIIPSPVQLVQMPRPTGPSSSRTTTDSSGIPRHTRARGAATRSSNATARGVPSPTTSSEAAEIAHILNIVINIIIIIIF